MSVQDSAKNTIRILIDRYPQSQTVDLVFQKIKPLIDVDHYELKEFVNEERMVLTHADRPSLEFRVARDETARALLFLRGDADVLYDSLSLAKTEWVRKQKSNFQVFASKGFTLSYLGFQNQHPILNNPLVRRAIAHALPVDEWIRYKFFNWVSRDTEVSALDYDLSLAQALLDEAGYPLKAGSRFSLRYFTTPVREGNETAQLVREALRKIGVEVQLITLETSLFFEKIQKGDFDLISSRWYRFSENAPAIEILGPTAKKNYVRYKNQELNQEFALHPSASLRDLHQFIENDLPLLPLYTWKHGLVASQRLRLPPDISLSLDETFRFLTRLEIK